MTQPSETEIIEITISERVVSTLTLTAEHLDGLGLPHTPEEIWAAKERGEINIPEICLAMMDSAEKSEINVDVEDRGIVIERIENCD